MNKEHGQVDWIKVVERPHPPLFLGVLFDGHESSVVKHTTGLDAGFQHIKKDGPALFISEHEFALCVQRIQERVQQDGLTFYRKYAAACHAHGESLLAACEHQAGRFRASDKSQSILRELLTAYFQDLVSFAPYLLVTVAAQKTIEEPLDRVFTSLEERIQDGMAQRDTIRTTLLHPLHPTQSALALQAERHILHEILSKEDLALQLRHARTPTEAQDLLTSAAPAILEEIHHYVQAYAWLPMDYYQGAADAPLSVLQRLLARLRYGEVESVPTPSPQHNAIESLLTSEEPVLISVVQELLFLRTYRLEIFFRAHALMAELWDVLAASLGLSVQDLPWLTHHELLDALSQTNTVQPPAALQSLLASRKSGFSVLKDGSTITWMAPPMRLQSTGEESISVEGTTAYPGRVRGIVKVAHSPEEARMLRPGHVLVTSMTTPAYGPYLHFARGIVTDEGGILSHAALLSREARIPCIVGSRNATSLFSTGDLVELTTDDQGRGTALRVPWRKGVRRWAPVLWRYFSTIGHGSRYAKPALEIAKGFDYCKNVDHQTFLARDDYEVIAVELESKVRADLSYFDLLASRCYSACEHLIHTAHTLREETPKLTETGELLGAFRHYHSATLATIPFRYAVTMLDDVLTRLLDELLRSKGLSDSEELHLALETLVVIARPSFEEAYREKLGVLANMVRGKKSVPPAEFTADEVHSLLVSPDLHTLALSVLEEFSWINTSYYTGEPLTLTALAEQIAKLLSEAKLEDTADREQAARTREELVQRLVLDKADLHLLEIAGLYTHLRSYRIAVCYKADFLVRDLLNKIAEKLRIEYDHLIRMTGTEIADSLERESLVVHADEISLRGAAFQVYLSGEDFWVETEVGEEDAKIHRAITSLSGRTAYSGHARGPVRIVLGKGEIGKLRKGDIIVAPMTTTDLTQAIRENCAGIITDEGGMTSHAAIISRESRIPCIVGTGNATEVLRDGDIVELQARDVGTVNLLSRDSEARRTR